MGGDNNITCAAEKRKCKNGFAPMLQCFQDFCVEKPRIPTTAVGEILFGMRYTIAQRMMCQYDVSFMKKNQMMKCGGGGKL